QASDEARAICNREVEQGRYGVQYKGLTFWTPNINIFRDPRWGRGHETYGEDPYLTAELGKSIVKGLEGDDPKYLKVSACAKHYAVHSGPESNRHVFDINVSGYDLWNTYLPAFQQLVEEAQVSSVMCAYNRYDGEPCCGNENLMIDILRKKWGFTGYVTSDCGALNNFWRTHKTSPDAKTAAAQSIKSGTDLECGAAWQKLWTYNSLEDAVKEGLLDEKSLDESVIRLFEIRMRLGMFDDPKDVPYAQIKYDVVNSPEHKAHALKLARQSMVLLKNNGILPLGDNVKSIGVVGPNANDEVVLLANYNGKPEEAITPLTGIKRRYPNSEVVYTKATDYTKALDSSIAVEANAVKDCDIVIFVGGISASLEGEEGATTGNVEGFKGGDRTTIALPRIQTEFMKRLKEMGKKVIFINMSGSAMGMLWESENVDAIIQAWYGGQATGTALADVLSGDYNPSGRLPLTFYKSDSDLPHFEDYLMTNRTYRYFKGEPLYEFGYGLSYTRFEYSNMKLERQESGIYTVEVDIHNAGDVAGDEVVQLYIKPEFESSVVALKSLRDFSRVSLKAGETCRVKFELDNSDFSIFNDSGDLRLIEGEYSVCVGGAQPSPQRVTQQSVATHRIDIKR
ncbi:MAG: glycoside hydrolase family 3 C-terminal domain-containing protein, partial [Rikenellaceae bacterium]